ncbi:type VI secretion system Vgr family protein [Burkholderia sp. LMG 21824]|uniref:type VI secretion system Vgr family protein n=1 Tax=Burkholderia sp. LMG 21824 TaxID=3158172 RepID=UPI003C2EE59B
MNMTEVVQAIRGGLIQQDRLLKTSIPSLPENALVPRRAVTYSELGRDFSVTLDMVSTAGDIELKTLIAQPMTLWIQQAGGSYLPINGYIHTARRLGADGSLSSYQLAYASWMHFLKFRSDMRYWQDKSVDAIITDVFNAHPQARGQFEFALLKQLPPRSYCRQSETDWSFVHRLMEEEGLFGFWRQDNDGKSHRFVVTDDIYFLDEMSSNSIGFSRSGTSSETDAFTQWAGSRTLQSTVHTTRTFDYKTPSSVANPKGTTLPTMAGQGNLPEQTEVYEYTGAYTYLNRDRGEHLSKIHLEEWESRAKRFLGMGAVRAIDAGRRFVLTGHPEHDRDQTGQREFAAIKVRRYIENNLPLSTHEASFPYSLQSELAQAKFEQTGEVVTHEDGSAGFYLVEVEAQRVVVPYRSPFEHKKPSMELETAIVVGPQGEEVYTDTLNRVKVMFVWDRQNSGDANASCWVRVAQSDTGGGYGSVHIPRVGEEVLIGYIGGDCDRPIVLHRVYNGSVQPQWHSNGILSGYRSKEYSGSGYNEMVLDDATGQNRTKLFSSTGSSMLHLGYLIEQNGNTRGAYLGSGFDLKTDSYGAVRAMQGLYVATHPKSGNGQQLDVREAQQQLVNAESTIEAMSQLSQTHEAGSLNDGHEALKTFTDATQSNVQGSQSGGRTAGGGTGSANGFKKALMLLASPFGIGASTQDSMHVTADRHINLVSGLDTYIATARSLITSAAGVVSMFAKTSMKMFSKGPVQIQSHQANVELLAKAVLKLLAQGDVEIAAGGKLVLTAGGASITLAGGNILAHAPGMVDVRGTQHSLNGPAQMNYPLPLLPTDDLHSGWFKAVDHTGQPIGGLPYKIVHGSQVHYGFTDDDGKTQTVMAASPDHMEVTWNPEHFEEPSTDDDTPTC